MDRQVRIRMLGVLVVATVAGCAGGASSMTPMPDPTVTSAAPTSTVPAGEPTKAPPASPSPSTGVLDGTMTASGVPDPSGDWTGCGAWQGHYLVADRRIAGEYRSLVCTQDRAGGGTDFWGVWVLWNEAGTWDGDFSGEITPAGDHSMDLVSFGTGDYAGLRLDSHAQAGPNDSIWSIRNAIEPGTRASSAPAPPPAGGAGWTKVTGSRSCMKVVGQALEAVGGAVTQKRGGVDQCDWSTTDSRLTAPDLTLTSADFLADGSGEAWGTLAMRTADGLWLGTWSMERASDGAAKIGVSLTGRLAYEGLVYQDVQVGKGDTWQITGWITEAD